MNKSYENPEVKVIYFQANEKIALLEHDASRGSFIDPPGSNQQKVEQDKT